MSRYQDKKKALKSLKEFNELCFFVYNLFMLIIYLIYLFIIFSLYTFDYIKNCQTLYDLIIIGASIPILSSLGTLPILLMH